MAIIRSSSDDEVARARLAYISAGQRPLSAPRRAREPVVDVLDAAESTGHPPPAGEAPVPLTQSRWAPLWALGRQHVMALLILLLCGVGVAVAALSRSSASQVPIEVTTVSQPPSPSATSDPTAAAPAVLRVHVLGAVQRPGVVSLTEGAIVLDAITAAGGLAADADPAELNLAARVADGQQIIVGTTASPRGDVVAEPGSDGGGTGSAGAPLNLNTASQAQLEDLPGVGPVLAGAILAFREEHGKFTSVAELQEVPGIGPKSFAKLEPLVTV